MRRILIEQARRMNLVPEQALSFPLTSTAVTAAVYGMPVVSPLMRALIVSPPGVVVGDATWMKVAPGHGVPGDTA